MYTSPKEVEIVRHADEIAKAYEEAFRKRYNINPYIETADLPVFSFLSKNFGLERGIDIVRHYLKMEDEWYVKNAHNAAVLRKNINQIIADFGKKHARPAQSIAISCHLSCDKCLKDFIWVGDPSELDRPSYTRLCKECKGD